MGLITVYFYKPDGFGYRKAIIEDFEIDFFMNLGAVRTVEDLKKPVEPVQIGPQTLIEGEEDKDEADEPISPIDPDKGFGVPGSIDFHRSTIMGMASIKDLNDYLMITVETPLDGRIKKLSKAKKSAIEMIKEWMSHGS